VGYNYDPIDGIRIFGPEKPQLIYYKNRWYTFLLDTMLNGFYAVDKNSIFFNLEPDNIFSLIKDSIIYRNHLIDKNINLEKKLNFFSIKSQESKIIGRESKIKKQYDKIHKTGLSIWNYKDHYALCETIKQQNLVLLKDYYKSIDVLLNLYPNYNYQSRNFSPMKFAWFIDIDSLEMYTQEELIPNGFET
jgi:hypothetical protein